MRAQTLYSIQAAENVMSSARDEKLNKGSRGTAAAGAHVSEDDIADLVGQLERYAENKTGKGKGTGNGFGGTNNANKPSAAGKKVRGLFYFIHRRVYCTAFLFKFFYCMHTTTLLPCAFSSFFFSQPLQ